MAITKEEYKNLQEGDRLLCIKSSEERGTKFTKGNKYKVRESAMGIYVLDDNNMLWYSQFIFNQYFTTNLDELSTLDIEPKLPKPPVCKRDVKNQPHYVNNGIEPIEIMKKNFTQDEYRGFLNGNVQKYLSRHKAKNGLEDLKKAKVYLDWLIEDWEK